MGHDHSGCKAQPHDSKIAANQKDPRAHPGILQPPNEILRRTVHARSGSQAYRFCQSINNPPHVILGHQCGSWQIDP